ncbi:MAG: hypothetical protein K2Q09_07125, partial [Phycisphaerales bacterium]|nr:hypothetical protein [Phycisphaerales bacterium]
MGKFDIDQLLNDLGVPNNKGAGGHGTPVPRAAPQPAAPENKRRHAIDQADEAFTILPAVPTGQRSFSENVTVDHDPAVPVPPAPAQHASMGQTLSEIYAPGEHDATDDHGKPLADVLLARAVITPAQRDQIETVLKASP